MWANFYSKLRSARSEEAIVTDPREFGFKLSVSVVIYSPVGSRWTPDVRAPTGAYRQKFPMWQASGRSKNSRSLHAVLLPCRIFLSPAVEARPN